MSVLIDLADELRDSLNAGSFSEDFTAERKYRPKNELADLERIVVTVAPASVEIARLDRVRSAYDYRIDVAVQQKLVGNETDADTQADSLMTLVQELADYALQLTLTIGGVVARCTVVGNQPAFAPEHWDELRTFTSILQLTFRVVR